MLTEQQILERASMRKPLRSSPVYHQWRKARIRLGLPTKHAVNKTADIRKYRREYMRQWRKNQKAMSA